MKTVDQIETTTAVALTRKEKLLRWAAQVRCHPNAMMIFHNMECWDEGLLQKQLTEVYAAPSAFGIAANDPVFKAAGIKGSSAADAMQFFELSQHDLHEFSCDCGGAISNHQMADRIEGLVERRPAALRGFARAFSSRW